MINNLGNRAEIVSEGTNGKKIFAAVRRKLETLKGRDKLVIDILSRLLNADSFAAFYATNFRSRAAYRQFL